MSILGEKCSDCSRNLSNSRPMYLNRGLAQLLDET